MDGGRWARPGTAATSRPSRTSFPADSLAEVARGVADLIVGTDLASAFANAILKVADIPVRADLHVAKIAHAGPELRIAGLVGTAHAQAGPAIGTRLRATLAKAVDRVTYPWRDAGHPASADN